MRIYSLEEIYKGINTRRIRNFLAFLIFQNPIQGIHKSKRRKTHKDIYKVRLCRSFANNNRLGVAPNRQAVQYKTVKYKKIFRKDNGKTKKVNWIGSNPSEKPKLQNGYSLHILWKKEWRPLFVKPFFKKDRSYSVENLQDIQIFCYLDNKSGKTKSWSIRSLRDIKLGLGSTCNGNDIATKQKKEIAGAYSNSTILSGFDVNEFLKQGAEKIRMKDL